jgi:hypothetical protein
MSAPDIKEPVRNAMFAGVDAPSFDLWAALWQSVGNIEMNYKSDNVGYDRQLATVLDISVNTGMENESRYIIDVHLGFSSWAWHDHFDPFDHTQADTIALCQGGIRGVDDRYEPLPLTTLATPVNEGYGDISHIFPTDWDVTVAGGTNDTHHYYAVGKINVHVGLGIWGVTMSLTRAVEIIKGLYGQGITAWPLIDSVALYHMQMTFADHSGALVEASYPGYARLPISFDAFSLSAPERIFTTPMAASPAANNAVIFYAGSEPMITAFFGEVSGMPPPIFPPPFGHWSPSTSSAYNNVYDLYPVFVTELIR